jgi:adenylate cyclase
MTNSRHSFTEILFEMWHEITVKTGKLLGADRTVIFLLDRSRNELFSFMSDHNHDSIEVQIPAHVGIMGEVVTLKKTINIPFDFYQDPRSSLFKSLEEKLGYRIYSLLALPLFNQRGELIAVVQVLNKLQNFDPQIDLINRIDRTGFTPEDETLFAEFVPLIRPILEKCIALYYSQRAEAERSEQAVSRQSNETQKFQPLTHPLSSSAPIAESSVDPTLLFTTESIWLKGIPETIYEILNALTQRLQSVIFADRLSICVLDPEIQELWSLSREENHFSKTYSSGFPESIGDLSEFKNPINISYDLFNDPRSDESQKVSQKTGYPIYTLLAIPILNNQGSLLGTVKFINKLKPESNVDSLLSERIDKTGFNTEDEQKFCPFYAEIQQALEKCQLLDAAYQKQQTETTLMTAIRNLSQSSLDLDETLQVVMNEAKKLVNTDRSVLWMIDQTGNELWTKIPVAGILREIRLPLVAGFVGRVATTGELLQIPFDVYNHPDWKSLKNNDQKTGYRVCSLLGMPVFDAENHLIAVIQLVNKKRPGEFPPYDPDDWPNPPDCWKTSFTAGDQELIQIFSRHVGLVLHQATLLTTLQQQDQTYQTIFNTLSFAIIYAQCNGIILTTNKTANDLLASNLTEVNRNTIIWDVLQLEKADFSQWFRAATQAGSENNLLQYYPRQTLLIGEESYPVNLSLHSVIQSNNSDEIAGVLVVIENLSDEKQFKQHLYQYMTPELADRFILENAEESETNQFLSFPKTTSTDLTNLPNTLRERKDVSILFSGIRSFTPLLENLEDQEVIQLLREYFESMTEAVLKYKGTVDKYIGDAIMAVFGSPLPLEDHAWYAVQTAIEMRQRLVELNVRRVENGKPAICMGIGINSDRVITTNIGASSRPEFTTFGEGVNIGSYLEKASKLYKCDIILSGTTYQPCAERIWARELDLIRIPDRSQPISIYQLLALRSEDIPEEKLYVLEHYSRGRELFLNQEFEQAAAIFKQVLEVSSWDKPAAIQLERCEHFLQTSLPEDWDGVWNLTEI